MTRARRYHWEFHGSVGAIAGVAQSAEHRFCKPTVVSSTLTASSARLHGRGPRSRSECPRLGVGSAPCSLRKRNPGGYPSGQRGQTVNLVALPSQVRILLHPCRAERSDSARRFLESPAIEEDAAPGTSIAGRTRGREKGRSRRADHRGCNSMVEYLPSKQVTWVRFPSPALATGPEGGGTPGGLRPVAGRDLKDHQNRRCRGSVGRARPW